MNRSFLFRSSLSVLLLAGTIAAIQPAISAMPSHSQIVATEPIKDPFLLKVRKSGGLCIPNQCLSELTILQDGTYRYGDALKSTTGKLNRKTFAQLKRRVARVNLDQVKSKPFTGLCPTAYDGPEISYLFLVGNQVEEISACKYEIDERNLLFKQANQLYEKIVEQVYRSESPTTK